MISVLLLFAFVMSSFIKFVEKRIDSYNNQEQALNKEVETVETKVTGKPE